MVIPSIEKQAFIDIVRAAPYLGAGPAEADRLEDILVTYDDVVDAIWRQQDLFAANTAYLTEALAVFNQNNLMDAGIYNGQTSSSPPLIDPIIIVNSTYTEVILTTSSPPYYKTLGLLGNTYVGEIALQPGTLLRELYVGPGSTVDILNSSLLTSSPPAQAITDLIWLPNAKNKPSTLKMATYQSIINQVILEPGSFYGGILGYNPELPCAQPVTAMTVTEITDNSFLVSWINPAGGYLFINPYFKKTNSAVWIEATEAEGEYVNDVSNTGFVFRHLEKDTFYDFRAEVICNNGGRAFTQVTTQTVCCGSNTMLSLYKNCPITILIKASPNPDVTQTLCNGVTIPSEYPEGNTITVNYLASVNCSILQPFVLDNVSYQLMPYNPATGTWDASGTPIGSFIDGNVVTVNVSVPA